MTRTSKGKKGSGTSGRYNGQGRVYLMKQIRKSRSLFKIGCSKSPKRRQKEIKRLEGNRVQLITSFKARKMRDAEGSAQRACRGIGMRKDRSRASNTDWHTKGGQTTKQIKTTIGGAVRRQNAKRRTKRK